MEKLFVNNFFLFHIFNILILAAKYCNANSGNKYYDSLGALKCLEENNGDYAVIALNGKRYISAMANFN